MFDLSQSPIRKNINKLQDGQLSIFEDDSLDGNDIEGTRKLQVRTILKDVENMLETMESNKNKQIKIAVMGEVKAGKSTFINVCAAKEIAYTDILEATAIVSEIMYSENEYARLFDVHGNIVKDCSFEEILEWTEEKIDNTEDFSNFGKIEIGINNEMFKNLILIDTPGLLSITSENHDVTNEYIAQTDYVLWVMNSRNLGSKAVNDYIDKIKLSGKPLIGIINKVDSVEELQEIKKYVDQQYSSVFEEIFYISASNAWNLLKSGDMNWKNKTEFETIFDCLEDIADDKEYSSTKTQYYQLQREREVHMIMQARISARKKHYDNDLATFAQLNAEMKKVIKEELKSWLTTELYMEEKKMLINTSGDEFLSLFENFSGASYLTDVIEDKYREISNFIYRKWAVIRKGLTQTSSQVLVDFKYDKYIDPNVVEENGIDMDVISAEGTKKGMKNGAMLGVAFAGYVAWLGPAAATVTFAGALVPCILPLSIGGAVLGNWLSKKSINTEEIENNARKKQELVDDLYKEVIQTAAKEIKQIGKTLYACTDHYYEERCEFYKEKAQALNFDFTEPEYDNFNEELEVYIQKLSDAIENIEKDTIIPPPSMEGL